MSSIRQDSSYTAVPNEYDKTVRDANFYLYARPLDDSVLGCSDDISLFHWALVAEFIDETTRTMEGNESGGKLRPYYFKESPPDADTKHGKFYKLDIVKTSPYKLLQATINNSLNGTDYSATSNNCQCWVKNLAKSISSKLAKSLEVYNSVKELGFLERIGKCIVASSVSSSRSITQS